MLLDIQLSPVLDSSTCLPKPEAESPSQSHPLKTWVVKTLSLGHWMHCLNSLYDLDVSKNIFLFEVELEVCSHWLELLVLPT